MNTPALDDLHARLVDLLASGEVAAVIDRILRQPKELASVVSRSYAHPNGFRKLVVKTSEDGTRLRVHHWPTGDTEPSNIHNHRWPLASAVIVGQLHSALFANAAVGTSVERYSFRPSQPGGEYTLAPDGTGKVRMTSLATLGPSATYALDAAQLHRVWAGRGTLTVVLSGPPERTSSDVYRSAGRELQSRNLPLLTADAVRQSLAILARSLQSQGCC
jgi:hypothetical protein